MNSEIFIVEHLGEGFLAMMPRPEASHLDENIASIAAQGIKQVVSLLQQSEANNIGLAAEEELVIGNSMEFLSFPIADFSLPEAIDKFSQLTATLYQKISQGKSTLVHCRGGIGRSGLFCAAILIHAGEDADKAFKMVSFKRGVEVPDTKEQYQWLVKNQAAIRACAA